MEGCLRSVSDFFYCLLLKYDVLLSVQHIPTTLNKKMESALRSLNNMEQRLNHGFKLYALLGPNSFVSIGEYSLTIALYSIGWGTMALYFYSRGASSLFVVLILLWCSSAAWLVTNVGALPCIAVLSMGTSPVLFYLLNIPRESYAQRNVWEAK